MPRRLNNRNVGASVEIAKEELSSRRELHHEIDVLRPEDNKVGRPPSCKADVRETCSNGVGCRGNPFTEIPCHLTKTFGEKATGRCASNSTP